MIPKKIHYCWFGGKELPELAIKCIDSWKKYFPDYEIIEWNENNFDINFNKFAKKAYENKKYAFFTDVARLYIIYNNGGIYFDTDVEVIKPFDDILSNNAFFGLENDGFINTGLGFGAEKNNKYIKMMLEDYDKRVFDTASEDASNQSCPVINSSIMKSCGFKLNGKKEEIDGTTIYPVEFFNPKGGYGKDVNITRYTVSIHHYDGSWLSSEEKKRSQKLSKIQKKLGKKLGTIIYRIIYLPYIIVSSLKEFGIKNTLKKIVRKCKKRS